MTIWVNTIVNNEENFIWFAVMSVVDFVDKVLIYDTGSTDKTVEIIGEIKKLKGNKIDFKEVGEVDKFQFPKMRQKMLDESDCDWILVLDGDEIWWENSIKRLVSKINKKGDKMEGIFVPMVVLVGDIYHIQPKEAGQYQIKGKKGHLSLRAFTKKIPGIHVDWPYGKESYLDENNQPIQERKDIVFLDTPYLHATHLKRSSRKRQDDKFKYELGKPLPKNFKYPEIFVKSRPEYIPSPWIKRSKLFKIWGSVHLPFRNFKRKLI